MSELKPCPFCGSTNVRQYGGGLSQESKTTICSNCFAKVAGHELWNKRPYENKIKADAVREALENTPTHRLHGEARLFHTQSSLLHYADKLERGECLNTTEISKKEVVREFLDSVNDTDQLSTRDMQFLSKFSELYFGDVNEN